MSGKFHPRISKVLSNTKVNRTLWNSFIAEAPPQIYYPIPKLFIRYFYKQPAYKQLALGWQIAKQLSGLTLFH